MKEYTYEVCVTKTSNTDGSPVTEEPLKFTAANHDDFYAILGKFRNCSGPVAEAPLEFVIGLKLFVDAVMKNKDKEPFASMVPYVKDIMKTLKADIKKNTSKPPQE